MITSKMCGNNVIEKSTAASYKSCNISTTAVCLDATVSTTISSFHCPETNCTAASSKYLNQFDN